VTFTDDGRGVAPDVVHNLGEPFNRAGRTGGSGMGLYVSRLLARRMRGELHFLSPGGQPAGLTVVLELPGAR
jgi:signal transduction histidine kinase